jgi:signal transduction histidine kinase
MIVHDLKMPLSTILPSLESLLVGDLGKLSKDQAHFIHMARRSAQEMLMLIQNLLDVAKMEEGKLKLHPELFNPPDWATSVVSTFKPLAEAANKKLTLTLGKDLTPLEGDTALLGRVLGNLISNALRHTPAASGEVAVTLYHDGNRLAVEVRDNGEGIPQEEQDRIFEKFVQGEKTRSNLGSGTGLGLTFCKMVVEAHGGQIIVFSRPKEGSVFTFRLPLKEAKPAAPPSAAKIAQA